MDLIDVAFPAFWQVAFALLFAPAFVWAAWTSPWRRLSAGGAVHWWCATIVALVLLWTLRASVGNGFTFHLLGVSLLTLVAGPRLALVGSAVVIAAVTCLRDGVWGNFAIDASLMAGVPIVITFAVLRVAYARLPRDFPVYIFVVAFFGSALAMMIAAAASAAAIVVGTGRTLDLAAADMLAFAAYLGLGEAMVTGMVLSAVIAARPDALATFSFEGLRRR